MTLCLVLLLFIVIQNAQGNFNSTLNGYCNRTKVLDTIKSYLETDSVNLALSYARIGIFDPRVFFENVQKLDNICSSVPAFYARTYCTEQGIQQVQSAIDRYGLTWRGYDYKIRGKFASV